MEGKIIERERPQAGMTKDVENRPGGHPSHIASGVSIL